MNDGGHDAQQECLVCADQTGPSTPRYWAQSQMEQRMPRDNRPLTAAHHLPEGCCRVQMELSTSCLRAGHLGAADLVPAVEDCGLKACEPLVGKEFQLASVDPAMAAFVVAQADRRSASQIHWTA